MSAAELPESVSISQYLDTEETNHSKAEYIEGWVRAMSDGSVRHNKIKLKCLHLLLLALEGKPCLPFDSDIKVRFRLQGKTRFYYPDAQVVCASNPDTDSFQDHPVFLVEVLSPSTRSYDLDEKMSAYLQIPSLEGYLVLEQHQPIAIMMRHTVSGYIRESYEGMDAVIDLPFLACKLALREVYQGVEFTPTCVRELASEYEVA